jgi:hypothetical protein
MTGRWFSGGYDEVGFDVRLRRVGPNPWCWRSIDRRFGGPPAVPCGSSARTFLVHECERHRFRPRRQGDARGVGNIRRDRGRSGRRGGRRRRSARRAWGRAGSAAALIVSTDRHDPRAPASQHGARAHRVPKMLAQFEAVAYHNGPDGKPDTKDDVNLGIVDASWSLEEYSATLNDEDIKYVGAIDRQTGLFTPNVDGPNPQRPGNANNIGDVWVVATYNAQDTSASTARPLRARAHLLVTVPLYVRWNASGGQ